MPRVWLWVRKWLYEDLEREAARRGIGVDDLILSIVEDYVKGKLVSAGSSDGADVRVLKARVERLEDEVAEIRALLRSVIKAGGGGR